MSDIPAKRMEARKYVTIERLKELYWYDPIVGVFVLKVKVPHDKRELGYFAGKNVTNGYKQITIDRINYSSHVLAWFYMNGEWPAYGMHVDHKDRNKNNNSIGNLRLSTPSQNKANSKKSINSKNRFKGVYPERKKFRSRIMINGERISLGTFSTSEEAHEEYMKKLIEVHGEYAYDGIS